MSHAGDLTPQEAYELLEDDPEAVLVDVRTAAEWAFVGLPDLSEVDKRVVTIEWNHYPAGHNQGFVEQLKAEIGDTDAPVLFLCRSGVRSAAAATAATQAGYPRAHNIAEGFEGNLDGQRHRGSSGGWKHAGLPWVQN